MDANCQTIHKIYIKKLKNISELDLCFDGKNVTAILGPNGSGKSTVLHALASAFRPKKCGDNYRFSDFFLPHPHAFWQGSELSIVHSYREGPAEHKRATTTYSKKHDRWAPRYESRPQRDIYYVGVNDCVPRIEIETKRGKLNYSTNSLSDNVVSEVLKQASHVLNRHYTALNQHEIKKGKSFIGVVSEGVTCSALSMSAGEQKVFYVLDRLYRADKYSLLLIDEFDLLLHESALVRLIKVVADRASEKSLQVVFTTHRESVVSLSEWLNIRHLVSKCGKTFCFHDTKPDAIKRLTGANIKALEIFVEDDLASAVVRKVAADLGLSKHLEIHLFGAVPNCFTTLGGLLLSGDICSNVLFVLDGDSCRSPEEKEKAINKVITGHGERIEQLRSVALGKIVDLMLPEGSNPEKYLYDQILSSNSTEHPSGEVVECARQINYTNYLHDYINEIVKELGDQRAVGLSRVIDVVSKTDGWLTYTSSVRMWLEAKKPDVHETFTDK
jgi:ABC-type phosphate transport system ATPase subunit